MSHRWGIETQNEPYQSLFMGKSIESACLINDNQYIFMGTNISVTISTIFFHAICQMEKLQGKQWNNLPPFITASWRKQWVSFSIYFLSTNWSPWWWIDLSSCLRSICLFKLDFLVNTVLQYLHSMMTKVIIKYSTREHS